MTNPNAPEKLYHLPDGSWIMLTTVQSISPRRIGENWSVFVESTRIVMNCVFSSEVQAKNFANDLAKLVDEQRAGKN